MGKKNKLNPDMIDVNENDPTLYTEVSFEPHENETRFYIEENILPVLVPALQKLLYIVHEEPESAAAKIDPLNWLGMYLMRNNPKHSDALDNHPYVQKIKKHLEDCQPAIEKIKAAKAERERLAAEKRAREAAAIAEANRRLEEQKRKEEERRLAEQKAAAARRRELEEAERRAVEEAERRAEEAEAARQAELDRIRKLQEAEEAEKLQKRIEAEEEAARLYQLQVEAQKLSDKRKAFLTRQKVYSLTMQSQSDYENFQQTVVDEMANLLPSQPKVYIARRQAETRFKPLNDTIAANEEKDLVVHVVSKNTTDIQLDQRIPVEKTALKAFKHDSIYVDESGSVRTNMDTSLKQGGNVDDEDTSSTQSSSYHRSSKDRPTTPLLNKKSLTFAMYNSNKTESGFVTVDFSDTNHEVTTNDHAFVSNCVDIVQKAAQSRDLSDSVKRVKKCANEIFNKNKLDLYNAGMDELLNFIPNATRALTTEMSDDGESMVCVAEKKHPSLRVDTSRKGKRVGSRVISTPASGVFKTVQVGKPTYYENVADMDDLGDDEGKGAVVIPLKDEYKRVIGVISINVSQTIEKTVIPQEQLDQLEDISNELGKSISKVDAREKLTILGQQAVDWITQTTDIQHAYFGLIREDGHLQYVAASEASKDMIGQVLPKGKGVAWKVVDSRESIRIDNIRKSSHHLHFFNDSESSHSGSFVTSPVVDRKNNVIGLLSVNRLSKTHSDKLVINDDEFETIQISAKTIAHAAEDIPTYNPSDDDDTMTDTASEMSTSNEKLAIEKDIKDFDKKVVIDRSDKNKTKFLKRMLLRCRKNVKLLDVASISELAQYKTPPKVIHRVLKAVFYLIGYQRAEIKEWKQCRQIIKKRETLRKIYSFDPTAKSKKFKWKQARMLVKSLTYDRMAKASRPALLMYSFTQIAFGLHDQAVVLRKKMALKQNEDPTNVDDFDGDDVEEGETEEDTADIQDDNDDEGEIDENYTMDEIV
mmetsp:Transcript_7436/g.10994  ORF Transcript_7436/g.10994 Transcript_7436/m.10994 type:complete len:986 (-) Transcript_7436:1288-4245(-)